MKSPYTALYGTLDRNWLRGWVRQYEQSTNSYKDGVVLHSLGFTCIAYCVVFGNVSSL